MSDEKPPYEFVAYDEKKVLALAERGISARVRIDACKAAVLDFYRLSLERYGGEATRAAFDAVVDHDMRANLAAHLVAHLAARKARR